MTTDPSSIVPSVTSEPDSSPLSFSETSASTDTSSQVSSVAAPTEPGGRTESSAARRVLYGGAALVILMAGLKAAQPVLVPLLLAGFVAILCMPLLSWLNRQRVPMGIAVLLVIATAVLALAGLALVLSTSVNAFSDRIPFYQERFASLHSDLQAFLSSHGIHLSLNRLYATADPGALMRLVSGALGALASALSNLLLVLLVVIFILAEAAGLRHKLAAAFATRPDANPEVTEARIARLREVVDNVQRYLAWKSLISLGTGLVVGLLCWVVGVDFPLLWALVAFLLNFVPNIGSLLAALPPVLLALIQLGPVYALIVAAGYVVVNMVFGNVVEPMVMGRKLGLSSLVVFLSLILWGFVWGPVGMLLSVPLTVMVRIGLESNPSTRWIAILMGPPPDKELPHARLTRGRSFPKTPARRPDEGFEKDHSETM